MRPLALLVAIANRTADAVDQMPGLLVEVRELLAELRLRATSPDYPLTLEEAARILRMRDADAERFLKARGILQHFEDRPRVRMGDLWKVTDEAERIRKKKSREAQSERTRPIDRAKNGVPSWDELRK